MKYKIFFTTAFYLLGSLVLFGQVKEEERLMSQGTQNAFTMAFDDHSSKDLQGLWRDFTKDYGKWKKVKKSDDYLMSQVQVMDISGADRLDIYAQVNKLGKEGAKLMVWVNDNGTFVSSESNPDAYAGTVKWLNNFGHYVRVTAVEEELAMEQKQLEDLEKELSKLERDREKYLKEIEKSKKTIEGRESDIDKYKRDKPKAVAAFEEQKEVVAEAEENYEEVSSILPKDQLKEIEKDLKKDQRELKKLEKEVSKLDRDKRKYERDIKNANDTVDKRMADLEQNKADQEEVKKKIEAQKELVEKVEKKVEKVKGEKPGSSD